MVWVEFRIHIPDVVGSEDFPLNLKTDKDSTEIFRVNKIAVLTDLILITVDLVQCIPHLLTPGVIVLTTPEINLLVVDMVVDILMDMITVDDWAGDIFFQPWELWTWISNSSDYYSFSYTLYPTGSFQ